MHYSIDIYMYMCVCVCTCACMCINTYFIVLLIYVIVCYVVYTTRGSLRLVSYEWLVSYKSKNTLRYLVRKIALFKKYRKTEIAEV